MERPPPAPSTRSRCLKPTAPRHANRGLRSRRSLPHRRRLSLQWPCTPRPGRFPRLRSRLRIHPRTGYSPSFPPSASGPPRCPQRRSKPRRHHLRNTPPARQIRAAIVLGHPSGRFQAGPVRFAASHSRHRQRSQPVREQAWGFRPRLGWAALPRGQVLRRQVGQRIPVRPSVRAEHSFKKDRNGGTKQPGLPCNSRTCESLNAGYHASWNCPLRFWAVRSMCPCFLPNGAHDPTAWNGEEITDATKAQWKSFDQSLRLAMSSPGPPSFD
jgi:hypothetical protein